MSNQSIDSKSQNPDIVDVVQSISRQARLLSWISAAGVFVASLIALLVVVGVLDYVCRYLDSGMRYLLFGGLLFAGVLIVFRLTRAIIDSRCSDLAVAQLIERHVSGKSDQISSAWSFLTRPDALAGQSFAMQRNVIAEASRLIEYFDPRRVFDMRSVFVSLAMATLAVSIAIGVIFWNMNAVKIALQRTIAPWSNVHWPRTNDLYVVNRVGQMAIGADFIAEIRDQNDRLPGQIIFEYQFVKDRDAADSADGIQQRIIEQLDHSLIARLENVKRSFRYRATGGDHTTPWFDMQVLPAPEYTDLKIFVKPPLESGIKPQTFFDDQIRAIAGSSFFLSANSSESLLEANIRRTTQSGELLEKAELTAGGVGIRYPATGRTATFFENESLNVLLTNHQQVVGGIDRTIRIDIAADREPVVDLASTSTATTTLTGRIALSVSVSEDVRIDRVEVICLLPDDQSPDRVAGLGDGLDLPVDSVAGELIDEFVGRFVAPVALRPRDEKFPGTGDVTRTGEYGIGQRFEGVVVLSIPKLNEIRKQSLKSDNLKFGDTITVVSVARDTSGQIGRSNQLVFRIRTPGELIDDLMEKQDKVYELVARALRRQKSSAVMFADIEARFRKTNVADQRMLEDFRTAKAKQTEVNQLLTSKEGAKAILDDIVRQLQTNKLDHEGFAAHIDRVREVVTKLSDGPLPGIQSELGELGEQIRQSEKDPDVAAITLQFELAGQTQTEIIDSLTELVGRFSHLDQLRNIVNSWTEIRGQQGILLETTNDLFSQLAGTPLSSVSERNRKQLQNAAGRQNELSRQTQRVEQELLQLLDTIDQTVPGYESARKAISLIQTLRIESRMRDAASEVAQNRLGNAASSQESIVADLDRLLRELRDETSAEREPDSELPETEASDKSRDKTLSDKAIREQLNQSIAVLDEVLAQQQKTIRDFADFRRQTSAHSSTQRVSRIRFADSQRDLAKVVDDQMENFSDQPLAEMVMRETYKSFIVAAELLTASSTEIASKEITTDDTIEREMKHAMQQLQMLVNSLQTNTDFGSEGDQSSNRPDQNRSSVKDQSESQSAMISLSEVRLLIELQQSILDETAALESRRLSASGKLTEIQTEQLRRLRERESILAEIVGIYKQRLEDLEDPGSEPSSKTPERESNDGRPSIPALPGFD